MLSRPFRIACCLLSFQATASAQSVPGQKTFALVIHGGAGSPPASAEARAKRVEVLRAALDTGTKILRDGGESLDVVEAVVRVLEDAPEFNAGRGAVFNAAGNHELDASIMDGRTRASGAVGGVRTVRNPISLARRVMTETRHLLLVSDGAEEFADLFRDDPQILRVTNDYFSTPWQLDRLKKTQKQAQQTDRDKMGTVGCVALDTHGNLAAATSTGGLNNKKFGRIGDSPIVCAGTFADNKTCAVSCTGIGEDFMRNAVAYDVSARMEYRGDSLQKAVADILTHPTQQVRGGIIAIDRKGCVTMEFNTEGMSRAVADSTGRNEVVVVD